MVGQSFGETQTLQQRGRKRPKRRPDAQEWRYPQHRAGTAGPCLHRAARKEFWLWTASVVGFLAKVLQFCVHSPFLLEINSISIGAQPRAKLGAHPIPARAAALNSPRPSLTNSKPCSYLKFRGAQSPLTKCFAVPAWHRLGEGSRIGSISWRTGLGTRSSCRLALYWLQEETNN